MEEIATQPTVEELECSTCHEIKPVTEFYPTSNYWHQKRGYSYSCKKCSRESARRSIDKKKKETQNENNAVVDRPDDTTTST